MTLDGGITGNTIDVFEDRGPVRVCVGLSGISTAIDIPINFVPKMKLEAENPATRGNNSSSGVVQYNVTYRRRLQ